MEGREEEELREVKGAEREERERARWMRQSVAEKGHRYPDGFRHISGVLERLDNWDETLSL